VVARHGYFEGLGGKYIASRDTYAACSLLASCLRMQEAGRCTSAVSVQWGRVLRPLHVQWAACSVGVASVCLSPVPDPSFLPPGTKHNGRDQRCGPSSSVQSDTVLPFQTYHPNSPSLPSPLPTRRLPASCRVYAESLRGSIKERFISCKYTSDILCPSSRLLWTCPSYISNPFFATENKKCFNFTWDETKLNQTPLS
jgi:hypothetical protein